MICSVEGTGGRDQDSPSNYSYLIVRLPCTLPHALVIDVSSLSQLQVCKLRESQVSYFSLLQRVLNLGPGWVEDYLKLQDLEVAGSEVEL